MRALALFFLLTDLLLSLLVGTDGTLLLEAIRLYAVGDTNAALALLEHPVVRANCITTGGGNPVRAHLLEKWRPA
jgi:hypothetical protein